MSERLAATWLRTFAMNGLTIACGAATGILAARLLMPEGRGLLEILRLWPGMLWSVGVLGLGEAVAHRVARTQGDPATIVASSFVLALVLAGVTAGAAFLLLPYLLGEERREWVAVAQWYGCSIILLNSIVSVFRGADHGELRFRRYNALPLLSALVYLCGLVIASALDLISVTLALWIFWSGSCIAALLILSCRIRDLHTWPSFLELKSLCALYTTFHSANLIFFIGGNMDRIVLATFWDNTAIGLYAVAFTWASTGLAAITVSFRTVLFPHLSSDTDRGERHALFAQGLRYSCLLLSIGTAGLGSITPWLVPVLFGPAFGEAVPTAVALLVAYLLVAMRQIIAQGLRGLGITVAGSISELISISAFLACVWPLTLALNLLGIAVALAISNLLALAFLTRYLERQLKLPIGEWWGLNVRTFADMVWLGRKYAARVIEAGRCRAIGTGRPKGEKR